MPPTPKRRLSDQLDRSKLDTRQRAVKILDILESYQFECEASPLRNAHPWIELRDIIEKEPM